MKKLFVCILLLDVFFATAQLPASRKELEQERNAIQQDIRKMQQSYNQLKDQSRQSLGQLHLLKKKISLQEKYIRNINEEIAIVDRELYRGNQEIQRLQKQLDTLKAVYSRSLVQGYKNRNEFSNVSFIFSATNFNDALRRHAYLKSFREYQKKQITIIKETQALITNRQSAQESVKLQKRRMLEDRAKEKVVLVTQQNQKDRFITRLKRQEKDLIKEINERKKRNKTLQQSIDAIVRRDKANVQKSNTSPTLPKPGSKATNPVAKTPVERKERSAAVLSTQEKEWTAGFEKSKGQLPWPVDGGIVTIAFGVYSVEGTSVKADSPGITIATTSGNMPVRAVYDGVVSGTDNREDVATIFLKHGEYYTVYSNLSGINVKKGDQVRKGQVIGYTGNAYHGRGGELVFVLMNDKDNVDPAAWLKK